MDSLTLTLTEQVYLIAIWHLKDEAYGVKIRDKVIAMTGKTMVFGTLYNNLDTLVKKGYVSTKKGGTATNRGGNTKVFYNLTGEGKTALQKSRKLQESIWDSVPDNAFI